MGKDCSAEVLFGNSEATTLGENPFTTLIVGLEKKNRSAHRHEVHFPKGKNRLLLEGTSSKRKETREVRVCKKEGEGSKVGRT